MEDDGRLPKSVWVVNCNSDGSPEGMEPVCINSKAFRISESWEFGAWNTSREVFIVCDMDSRASRMHFLISLMEPRGDGVLEKRI